MRSPLVSPASGQYTLSSRESSTPPGTRPAYREPRPADKRHCGDGRRPEEVRMAGWRDDDPGLPIKFGPCSNGEYEPEPLTPVITETIRRAREECERNARRLGMGRREFLLSSMAAATTLLVLDACTKEQLRSTTRRRTTPGGTFSIPSEATTEPSAA